MSLLKLSGMRQSVQEALDLSVDLVTTAGIEDEFYKNIGKSCIVEGSLISKKEVHYVFNSSGDIK